jgi:hypothetical protein
METSVSAIFKELGYDPAGKFDFSTRLMIQEVILERLDGMYALVKPEEEVIADRTPLDMLAYTLSECSGDAVSDADQARLKAYIDRCYAVCNKRFSTIFVVQPGIELVPAEGKAVANEAYIEQLNTLILGLTVGGRLKSAHYYLPRHYTALEDRLRAMEFALKTTKDEARRAISQYRDAGMLVH